MDGFLLDIRSGWRGMLRSRGATMAAVLSLALGIGANSAVFSVVHAVLLRPLPYPDSARIMEISATAPDRGIDSTSLSYPRFASLAEHAHSFSAVGAFVADAMVLAGGDEPVQLNAARMSSGALRALGVEPLLGRNFTPDEDRQGSPPVVILSHGLWQRRFNADPAVLGSSIRLDGAAATIVGVMPPEFDFPSGSGEGGALDRVEAWSPRVYEHSALTAGAVERGASYLGVIARLAPGATQRAAQAELDVLARAERRTEFLDAGFGYRADDLYGRVTQGARPMLLLLLAAVGLVLLIACANVANLLLARAVGRQKEMAVRAALGAGRGRLVRQLLTESALLALPAGALGLALAATGLGLLTPAWAGVLPRGGEIGIDANVLALTAGLALATSLVFGLAPALRASRVDLVPALNIVNRGTTGGPQHARARSSLVVGEVAVAVMLLIGASLLVQSFARLHAVVLGFSPDNLIVATVSLPSNRYAKPEQIREFFGRLTEDLQALPGVTAVSASQDVPLGGSDPQTLVAIDGRPLPPLDQRPVVSLGTVSPGFFHAMSIPLLAGRDFSAQDGPTAPIVVVVNRSFVRKFFPNEEPIGKRIVLGRTPTPREIVGVVGDVRHVGLDTAPAESFYLCANQRTVSSMAMVVRSNRPLSGLGAAIRGRVTAIDHDQPIGSLNTMVAIAERSIANRRLTLLLFGLFAATALVLAAIGVYSVMAYAVSERTAEIGLRMALGADSKAVIQLVVLRAVTLALGGAVLGAVTAFALSRYMASQLFEVSATNPPAFVASVLGVLAVAVLASLIPARRAVRIEPNRALRDS